MNLIENLWDEVERRMKKYKPKNIHELGDLLKNEWDNIELPVLDKLANSVPNRLRECIKMKGYPIQY